MLATKPLFALLPIGLLTVGCASTGEYETYLHTGIDSPSSFAEAEADIEVPSVEVASGPSIKKIQISPATLPVGGGEVEVVWTGAADAAYCTLSIEDSEDVKLGPSGRFEATIVNSAEVFMVCSDAKHIDGPASGRFVQVQPLPTEVLGEASETFSIGAPHAVTFAAKVDEAVPHFFDVSLEDDAIFKALAVTDAEDTALSIWLIHDANNDGFIDTDEVIDYEVASPEASVQERLDAGDYTVIVIPRNGNNGFSLTLQTKP